MPLNLTMPQHDDLKPRITVFGVGGAGGNAVDNMIDKALEGVEFVVANTDAQALAQSKSANRVQMGVKATEGLGAGARPQVGAQAAEESIEEIIDHLAGTHMCFITAGMGGGTGTGATPIIAQAARELGVLTVGVVTKPFQFEGSRRMRQAEDGIDALQKMVDTLIIIPNQNLFRLANEKTTCTEAFGMADDVLYQGVKGVTDLMVRPGLINLDFADVRSVMDEMGKAMMGTGEAEGDDRAKHAAEMAIANPLLDEISLNGAKGVLINIIGGADMTLYEMDEAANVIRETVDPEANIIVGSTLDESMEGRVRVSVVATGIDASELVAETPQPHRRRLSDTVPAQTLPAPEAEPAPAPQATMPAAAPAPAAVEVEASSEPDFFADWEARRAAEAAEAAPAPRETRRTELYEVEDDVPAQSYAPPQPAPARGRGEPSPEALARLARAVGKVPGQSDAAPAPQPRPAPVAERSASAAARAQQAQKERFGINSLIHRMTGAPDGQPVERPAGAGPAPARRPAAPQPERFDAPEADRGEADRIEIPAFLRRQAN